MDKIYSEKICKSPLPDNQEPLPLRLHGTLRMTQPVGFNIVLAALPQTGQQTGPISVVSITLSHSKLRSGAVVVVSLFLSSRPPSPGPWRN